LGLAFYERAGGILEAVEEAKGAAGALQRVGTGGLRINAPVSFGLLHLAPVLTDFLQRFPDVSVELLVNDRLVDLLEGKFDLASRPDHPRPTAPWPVIGRGFFSWE
jgi:DNA-binding transcriptional LysR family regulator